MADPLVVNNQITIPRDELQFTFARSSGPGGQNVNKVNTKAVLHWSIYQSQSLPGAVRDRFARRFATRISDAGQVVIQSDTHRTQARNVSECLDRLRAMLLSVARPPTPRKKTKPSRAAKEKRLRRKHHRSSTKRLRQPPEDD